MSFRHSDKSVGELLLKLANKESLKCLDEAPLWIKELSSAFTQDLGLLALHGPGGLSEQLPEESVVRIPLCAVDNTLMLLARNAVHSKQHVGIAIPPGAVMMPMLLVCKLIFSDLLDEQLALEGQARHLNVKQNGGILLLSPDAEVRARYFSMRVGPENVMTSYHACRMRPDGTAVPIIAKQAGLPPECFSVCFFLAHQKQLPNPESVAYKPSVVVLDFTHDKWVQRRQELLKWCLQLRNRAGEPSTVITLLPFGDSLSREALEKSDVPIFPLDGTCISELARGFPTIKAPTNKSLQEAYRSWSFSAFALEKPLDRAYRLYYVPDEAASSVIETVGHIYSSLDAVSERQFGRDLRLAAWLVGTLMQLPIPVQWYEQHAYMMGNRQTLKKLISGIGSGGQGAMNAQLAPTLQALRGQLELLYTRLSDVNPKSFAFLNYCREELQPLLEEGKDVAVICRNDVIARALWPWMHSEGVAADYQNKLHVLAFKQLDGRDLFDYLLSTGPWPTRYRWQLGGRLARTVDLLLYRGEENIIEKQLRTFYSSGAKSYFEYKRLDMLNKWGTVSAESVPQVGRKSPRDESVLIDLKQVAPSETHTAEAEKPVLESAPDGLEFIEEELNFESLFQVIATNWEASIPSPAEQGNEDAQISSQAPPLLQVGAWYEEAELPDTEQSEEALPVDGPTEECLLLKIQSASEGGADGEIHYLYVGTEGTTECFIPGNKDEGLTTVDNDEVEPGFVLLRTDQADRRGLFERLVQLADAQPTMKYLKVWRQHWVEAIDSLASNSASGRARRGTYKALRAQLAEAGVKVSPLTVRSWVLGHTIGPYSLESIKAVGVLSQHIMVMQYPTQIDAAFKQIRVIHQAVGRRISKMLQRLGQATQVQGMHGGAAHGQVQLDPALSVSIDDLMDMLEFWEVMEVINGPWQVPAGRVNVVLRSPLYGSE
jgi:hypothetical protein